MSFVGFVYGSSLTHHMASAGLVTISLPLLNNASQRDPSTTLPVIQHTDAENKLGSHFVVRKNADAPVECVYPSIIYMFCDGKEEPFLPRAVGELWKNSRRPRVVLIHPYISVQGTGTNVAHDLEYAASNVNTIAFVKKVAQSLSVSDSSATGDRFVQCCEVWDDPRTTKNAIISTALLLTEKLGIDIPLNVAQVWEVVLFEQGGKFSPGLSADYSLAMAWRIGAMELAHDYMLIASPEQSPSSLDNVVSNDALDRTMRTFLSSNHLFAFRNIVSTCMTNPSFHAKCIKQGETRVNMNQELATACVEAMGFDGKWNGLCGRILVTGRDLLSEKAHAMTTFISTANASRKTSQQTPQLHYHFGLIITILPTDAITSYSVVGHVQTVADDDGNETDRLTVPVGLIRSIQSRVIDSLSYSIANHAKIGSIVHTDNWYEMFINDMSLPSSFDNLEYKFPDVSINTSPSKMQTGTVSSIPTIPK